MSSRRGGLARAGLASAGRAPLSPRCELEKGPRGGGSGKTSKLHLACCYAMGKFDSWPIPRFRGCPRFGGSAAKNPEVDDHLYQPLKQRSLKPGHTKSAGLSSDPLLEV